MSEKAQIPELRTESSNATSLAGVTRICCTVPTSIIGLTILDDWDAPPEIFSQLVILKLVTVISLFGLIPFTYARCYHRFAEFLFLLVISLILFSLVLHADIQHEPTMVSFSALTFVVFSASVMPWSVRWQVALLAICLMAIFTTHWLTYIDSFWPLPKTQLAGVLTICFASVVVMKYTLKRQEALADATSRLFDSERQAREFAEKFERLALTDYLTDAGNLRGFYDTARSCVSSEHVRQGDLCLVLMDLDHFKCINDRHGHAAGDQILKQFVDICRSQLPQPDSLFRIGGEEFVLLLPNTSPRAAMELAESLRLAVCSQRLRVKLGSEVFQLDLSVSMGVTQVSDADTEIQSALERCDQALYQAKSLGRNQVLFSDVAMAN